MSNLNDLEKSFFEDIALLSKLVVGIGEVEKITNVPQRQIRYWQEKGIIQSIDPDGKGITRCFSYFEIKKILLIKELLDEGFTLEAADKKVMHRMTIIKEAFDKLKERNSIAANGDQNA
jgi:DNA-binding transcriptional MerR regulator